MEWQSKGSIGQQGEDLNLVIEILNVEEDVNVVFQILQFLDVCFNCIVNFEFIKLFFRVKFICIYVSM